MYESPINQILGEMQISYENECLKAVQSCGFDVNREELLRAVKYDREQYSKGYSDGYAKAIDEFVKAVESEVIPGDFEKMELYTFLSVSNIKKIAEQLKGVQE
jgi:hypothetical protein